MGQIANEMLFRGISKIADDIKYKSALKKAQEKQIVLASNSPRRKELLADCGIEFIVDAADVEENTAKTMPAEVVMELSQIKAKAVALRHKGEIILAADTIVALGDKILGKPADEVEALKMLESLMGKKHQVYTGATIIGADGSFDTFYECTDVQMREATREELLEYIATGEPMDKAGAYGIQGLFAEYVIKIDGDYNNVVGLPVGRIMRECIF